MQRSRPRHGAAGQRSTETRRLKDLQSPDTPRVAIVGATGTGKTALALELATVVAGPLRARLGGRDGRLPGARPRHRQADACRAGRGALAPHRHRRSFRGVLGRRVPRPRRATCFRGSRTVGTCRSLSEVPVSTTVPSWTGWTYPAASRAIAAELEHQADQPGGLAELFGRLCELDPVAASQGRAGQPPQDRPGARGHARQRAAILLVRARPGHLPGDQLGHHRARAVPLPSSIAGLPSGSRTSSRGASSTRSGHFRHRPAGLSRTARQAIGYRELLGHLEEGVLSSRQRPKSVRRLRAFARRQEAWFRRDPRVVWIRADRSDLCDAVAPSSATDRCSARGHRHRLGRATLMSMLTLVKYHGLGNDFLVALDGRELDAAARRARRPRACRARRLEADRRSGSPR